MKKIAVCDDCMTICSSVKQYCMQWIEQNQMDTIDDCCIDIYSNAVDYCASEMNYDLLYLDIKMPGMNGIRLKNLLENRGRSTLIVYITNHSECMRDAFGKNVIGFLEKPVQKKEIFCILDRIKELEVLDIEMIIDGCHVKIGHIMYMQSKGSYVEIYIKKQEKRPSWDSLNHWGSKLQKYNFLRIHRSYLVNMDYVEDIYDKKVKLTDGTQLPISRSMQKQVKETYQEMCRRRGIYIGNCETSSKY